MIFMFLLLHRSCYVIRSTLKLLYSSRRLKTSDMLYGVENHTEERLESCGLQLDILPWMHFLAV